MFGGGDELGVGPYLVADFDDVVVVVGEGGMNVGQSEPRIFGHDFVRRTAHLLVPDGDVGYPNPVPGNARPTAADSRDRGDSFGHGCVSFF